MSRQLGILLAGAVILGSLVLFTVNPFEDQIRRDNPNSGLLFSLDAERIEGFSIRSAAQSYELVRQGGTWVVASQDNYPGDTALIGRMIRATVQADAANLVSRKSGKHGIFEVTPEAGVSVRVTQEGSVVAEFIVGKTSPDEYASSYLQVVGEPDVYLVNPMNKVLFIPNRGFRDRRISDFTSEAVRELQWTAADTGWVVTLEDSVWMVESPDGTGGEADPGQVGILARLAAGLMASGFAGEDSLETGLDHPLYELVVGLMDGNERRILVGNQDPSGSFYAARPEGHVIFLISERSLGQFRRQARGLLKVD